MRKLKKEPNRLKHYKLKVTAQNHRTGSRDSVKLDRLGLCAVQM